ncbi:MAG: UDP-3-O-acyl-N-acetylglucosamine deacetylase [Phycisphaerales bacterium]|nr:UDP-3-O-acyl-N-acetylglucosamine deacetylase [Phycisphaerales bacterium]
MIPSRTLNAPSRAITGRGLFTGIEATLRITPAEPGSGIAFVRTDLGVRVPATIEFLAARAVVPAFSALPPRHTVLASRERPDATIATTEHVLGALAGLGITDATIELDAPEVPHADGSALPFVDLIRHAGVRGPGGACDEITLDEPVVVERDGARIEATPRAGPGCTMSYDLAYPAGSPIRPARVSWGSGASGAPEAFARDVAPARTFCLEEEARVMRSLGLLTHLGPGDALVYGPAGPIDNAERVPDEPARHKLLDLVGDLALLGRPLRADVHASRSGHALTHELCRAILTRTR